MNVLEDILHRYFVSERARLDAVYTWKIPEEGAFGFKRGEGSNARENMRLRRFLRDLWNSAPTRQSDIARWYVSVWGGIRSNKFETIERYIQQSESTFMRSDWRGVATWSKILAIRDPDSYAIYDARVGAALMAVQVLNEVENPLTFPQVPSRNSTINKFQIWLAQRSLPKRTPAYGDYISLLNSVCEKSAVASLDEVEMLLFANAEDLARCGIEATSKHSN
jgi:hypothetical protein